VISAHTVRAAHIHLNAHVHKSVVPTSADPKQRAVWSRLKECGGERSIMVIRENTHRVRHTEVPLETTVSRVVALSRTKVPFADLISTTE
jgi:hypothetical protein